MKAVCQMYFDNPTHLKKYTHFEEFFSPFTSRAYSRFDTYENILETKRSSEEYLTESCLAS